MYALNTNVSRTLCWVSIVLLFSVAGKVNAQFTPTQIEVLAFNDDATKNEPFTGLTTNNIKIQPEVLQNTNSSSILHEPSVPVAPAWECDCNYRREIVLTNAGGALTAYQIRIDVAYSANMNSDFSDLKFTTSSDIQLNHWVELKQDGVSAIVWVKVPVILATSTSTLYMYYGGCTPVATNPANVFVFYDDFSTFTGWSDIGTGTVVQNTAAFSYPVGAKSNNDDYNGGWKSIGTTLNDFRLITREQRPSSAAGNSGGALNRYGVENSGFSGYTINRNGQNNGSATNFGYERRANNSGGNSNQVSLEQAQGTWFRTELRRCSAVDLTGAELFDDSRTSIGGPTPGSISGHNYSGFDRVTIRGGHDYYIDFMAVAYYTCTEPTFAIGTEEDISLSADFNASAISITTGSSINFTDASVGTVTSSSWSFPGGTPSASTDPNPTNITYNSAGTYNVSLTVTNDCNSDIETKTALITVETSGVETILSSKVFVVPPNVYSVEIEAWAGGGGGSDEDGNSGGGGGGGGGFSGGILNVSPGDNIVINVGNGGDGGAGNNDNGDDGNNTVVTHTDGELTAYGGSGGDGNDGSGGSGGVSGSFTGIVLSHSSFIGGSGGDGDNNEGGGGGGGAGNTENGGDGSNLNGGSGGNANGGNGGNGGDDGAGIDGSLYSGGGGAAGDDGGGGGNGANGAVIINWSITTTTPSCTTPIYPIDNEIDIANDGTLSWNGVVNATGYRIYFGTDALATNIENGTDLGNVTSYTPASSLRVLTEYYWKIVPYNAIGDASGCNTWTFTTMDYCIPNYTNGTQDYGDYIANVTLGDIDTTTTGATTSPYYTYYDMLSTDLKLDSSYTISLSAGIYGSNNILAAWIDFNKDGDFNDSGEKLIEFSLAGSAIGTHLFTVPSNAVLGTTRLRVREAFNETGMGACTEYTYGETEDYNLNIIPSCTDATLTLNTANDNQELCQTESITNIEYTVGGDATGAGISGLPAGISGNFNSGTFTISGAPTESGIFDYTVTTTGTTGCSEATAIGTITVNALPTAPTGNNNISTYNGAVQSASATVGADETMQWFTSATNSTTTTAPSETDTGIYTAWVEAVSTTTGCVSATRTEVTLTINKKDLHVTATTPDITYGDSEPVVTVQYSGFEGSDDASVLDNTGFTLGTNYTQGNPVGTYSTSIIIGTANDNNYNFSPLNTSPFVVGKNVLTVTAGDQTVSYATHDGVITLNGTYTISGFVNGDNSSVVIGLGSVSYTGNYTETTNVGSSGITITPEILGLSAANYTLVTANGNITIVKADQYIACDCVPFSRPLNEFDTIPIGSVSSSGLPVIITLTVGSVAKLNGLPGNYYLTDIGATGTVTLYANQAGDANYNPAVQATRIFDVTKSNQNISFPAIDDLSFYNGLTKTLDAVASSGLPVDYTVVSGPATVSGNLLTINGAGAVSVRANQPGDVAYNFAASVLQTFTVSKGTQTITINVPPGTIDNTTPITATSTSGLSVTLTLGVGSDATSLTGTPGGLYTLSGIGTIGSGFIYIVGNQVGDANFMVAPQVMQTIDLGKSNQTITFNPITDQTYSPTLTISLTATASSSLSVSYTLVSGPATLAGDLLSFTGVGTVIVEASQAGNATYNPAPVVTQQFEILKATPVISLAAIVKTYGDAPFAISPTSVSTGSFSFISGDDDIYTISGNTATIVGAGTTILDITQQPSANYNGATKTVLFTVNKAASTISVNGAISFTYNGTNQGPGTSTVTGSTGAVTYSYEGGTSYGPSTIQPIDAGAYVATATVAEDDNYLGATSTAPYDFTISKANATISIFPYNVSYDGTEHRAGGTAKGVSAEDLVGLDLSGSARTLAGTYSYDWDFIDETGNYNDDSGTISNVINPATLSITAIDQSKCFGETFTFNGSEFISSGLIGAETIGSVTLTSTGASAGATAGIYAITPSGATGGTFNPSNYGITYFEGEMVVNPLPTLNGASQDVSICEGNTASINLIGLVTGSTFTIDYLINSIAQTPISGLLADGSGNSSFSTPVLAAANDGQVLRITKITITSESPNCEEIFAEDITLSVNPLPTLAGASQAASVCEGSAATIGLNGLVPNTIFTLSYTINGGVTIVLNGLAADGSGNSSFTTSALTLANNGQTLQIVEVEDESSACNQTFTQDIVLEVNPNTVGGTATAAQTSICENSTTSIELTGYTGTIQWQQSADGNSGWINVSGGSGATTDTYTTPGLTAKTYYRAVVTSGNCVSQNSTNTSVTVDPVPTLGGVTQAATVCDGSNATINLSGLLPNTTFTLEYMINGGSAIVLNGLTADASGNSSFTTPVLIIANNGETLRIDLIEIESTSCVERFTQNIILDVDPNTEAGTASSDQTICNGDTPTDIILAGSTGAVQWQSSPDNSAWTNIPGASGTTLTGAQMGVLTNTTYYRAEVTSGVCTTLKSNTVTITVRPLFTTGAIETTGETICTGGDPAEIGSTTAASGGDGTITYEWRANGTTVTSSNSVTYNPPSGLTSTTTYTRWVKDNTCNTTFTQSTGSWIVTVNPSPAIALSQDISKICFGEDEAAFGYSISSGSPDEYSIDFEAAAETAGFIDVVDATLLGGTIIVNVPFTANPATYSAILTVKNNLTNCTSEDYDISFVVHPLPATGEITTDN